jgi:hypothetical protein
LLLGHAPDEQSPALPLSRPGGEQRAVCRIYHAWHQETLGRKTCCRVAACSVSWRHRSVPDGGFEETGARSRADREQHGCVARDLQKWQPGPHHGDVGRRVWSGAACPSSVPAPGDGGRERGAVEDERAAIAMARLEGARVWILLLGFILDVLSGPLRREGAVGERVAAVIGWQMLRSADSRGCRSKGRREACVHERGRAACWPLINSRSSLELSPPHGRRRVKSVK